MHWKILADSGRHSAMREGSKSGVFWCKKVVGGKDLSQHGMRQQYS